MEDAEDTPSSLRRGQRQRKLSLKAQEYSCTPRKYKRRAVESSDDSDFGPSEPIEKPTVLHSNDVVSGDKIFTFHTYKRKDAILQKASQTCEEVSRTPNLQRKLLQKHITKTILAEDGDSDLDYSDSGSEYVASESESPDSASSTSSSAESDQETARKSKTSSSQVKLLPKNLKKPLKMSKNYTIKTDDYFNSQSSKKIVTSNHTLDKLETPRLPQSELQQLLNKVRISDNHLNAVQNLKRTNLSCFGRWKYLLHEGFNVLLYGLGSKKNILDEFHKSHLKNSPVIVVNGFFPSLTVKDVLNGIVLDLLELKECPSNLYEACDLIAEQFSRISMHLYLIVHNIERIAGGKSQGVFARLAQIRNIHLVVSIDHINAPLIWDHSKLGKFNFTWWDVTTFRPYIDETSFESSMMVQTTGTLALSSLRNVFLSLTSNSKGIYLLVVKDQLENSRNRYYQGLAFKDLYMQCREAFLVSSDLALRTQLTEFVDHKMVKVKRSVEGTEHLTIPLNNAVLQQFLNEHGS